MKPPKSNFLTILAQNLPNHYTATFSDWLYELISSHKLEITIALSRGYDWDGISEAAAIAWGIKQSAFLSSEIEQRYYTVIAKTIQKEKEK